MSKIVSLENVVRWQKELRKSLSKEFQELAGVKKEYSKIFLQYEELGSLAGMELWLNSYNELEYFSDLKKELKEYKKKQGIEEFHQEVSSMLNDTFSDEDYRFIMWERTEPDYEKLNSVVDSISADLQKYLTEIYPIFSKTKEELLLTYLKASGDPSVKGIDIDFIEKQTPKAKLLQFKNAEMILEAVWKDGFTLYQHLTNKIVFVQSKGLVSYTHFNEPGILYINILDRDLFETVDDLIHENAHLHCNLVIKKYKIFTDDMFSKEQIFYSPWRLTLRPLYGVFHAVFTFSQGAELFLNITNSEDKIKEITDVPFVERACLRFCQEVLKNEFSLQDLKECAKNGIFAPKGKVLIEELDAINQRHKTEFESKKSQIKSEEYKEQLRKTEEDLRESRLEYPWKLPEKKKPTKKKSSTVA